jgi:hypothetical protein
MSAPYFNNCFDVLAETANDFAGNVLDLRAAERSHDQLQGDVRRAVTGVAAHPH